MIPFFSRMFPSTNLQDLNLDWICRRIMELSKGIIAPWINPENQDWMVYDTETEQFVDSGVSAAGGGYVKPDTGIPKSDLSSAVQDSLDKADTALQSVPDTYRTAAAQDVIDNALRDSIASATEYKTGDGIEIAGLHLAITNAPAGDSASLFTIAIETAKAIPTGATLTLSRLPQWIRGNGEDYDLSHTPTPFSVNAITRTSAYTITVDLNNTSGRTVPKRMIYAAYFVAGTTINIS